MRRLLFSKIRNRVINFELISNGTKCDLKTKLNCSDESILKIPKAIIKKSNFYVRKNSKIIFGNNCLVINSSVFVDKGSTLIIGNNCKLIDTTISIRNQGEIIIGDDSYIGSDKPFYESEIMVSSGCAHFGSNANIKGKISVSGGDFLMGSNTFFNHGSEIRCEEKITIGDFVFISYFVDIYDTNTHSLDWRQRMQEVEAGYPNSTIKLSKPLTKPISIGDSVWIGKNAAILKGSNIGSKSIVGMRTVVTKLFPDNSLICGNPGKLIRSLEPDNNNSK